MLGTGDAGVALARRGKDPPSVYPRDLPVDPESPRDRNRLLTGDEAAAVDALDGFTSASRSIPAPFLAAFTPSFSHSYHDSSADVPAVTRLLF